MEHPNYYAVIPAEVRYDKNLRPNAKLFYGEITALTQKNGECWASNNYFADLYNVDPSAISKWVKNLENCGYITVEYIKGENNEIKKRIIKIRVLTNDDEVSTNIDGVLTNDNRVLTKDGEGYCQKHKENNTSINNKKEEKENKKEKVETENLLADSTKKIIDFYENNITMITPFVAEDMNHYLQEGLEGQLIIECMKKAVSRNKRNWKYIVSILNDCCNNNITTVKQFEIKQKEFRSNKNIHQKMRTKEGENVEYEEVEITNEEEYIKKVLEKG